jgi:arginyl-tRNA synthetase
MNALEHIAQSFFQYLHEHLQIPQEILHSAQFELNTDAQKQQFGDINCNIAMICAQKMKKNPRQLAQEIIQNFSHPMVQRIEIAGPGFLNFFLNPVWFASIVQDLNTQKDDFFRTTLKHHQKVNIEFVSANPTGPMHVGHGRNGILGDVLANILKFLHHDVTKEFYINDAGAQITKLGMSLQIRCMQELGHSTPLPEDAYHGEYLIELAQQCVKQFGKNLEHEPAPFFQEYGKQHLLAALQTTLENYGIIFDIWFSEKTLHEHGKIKQALARLIKTGHTYELEGALWFRSTTFGDDKDRVLQKANGELTYVAADVAYLIDKLERGFEKIVMILGHDHHSYKIRLESLMQALGYDLARLNVILYQLVHVIKDGQPVKMSKRSGNMVTLAEVIEEVGCNVARFFFLNRKADAELQFDLNLAVQQSNENPMYYIQYALVRTGSIQAKASECNIAPANIPEHNFSESEKLLIKKMCSLKPLIANIAHHHQIHLLAHYTYELAGLFHQFYNQERVLDVNAPAQSAYRLFLVESVRNSLQTALFLMGIVPMQKM